MYNKQFFEKVFSSKRMERYFEAHQDEQKAILHYQCNIELAESFYISLSTFEVALRNAIRYHYILVIPPYHPSPFTFFFYLLIINSLSFQMGERKVNGR